MFLDCPAYLNDDGNERCGLPAEVRRRFTMRSTDGPLETAMIRCPVGHWLNGPIECLTLPGGATPDQGHVAVDARARRDRITSEHDRPDSREGRVVQDVPWKPEQEIAGPNGAPPYYLGRPAWLWITAQSPRGTRPAPDQMVAASIARRGRPTPT
jgi:hypothetical protein